MWKDFKKFALRGNVIDLAVGVIIGAAFGKIVSSMVNDIIMPIIGVLTAGVDFKTLSITLVEAVMDGTTVLRPAAIISYGNFLQNVVDFLIVAFFVFLFVRLINRRKMKEEAQAKQAAELAAAEAAALAATAPKVASERELLEQIRDLLKNQKGV